MDRHPLILAHRGYHADLPENTMAAFESAARLGFDGIETDVQLDRFGVPILFHDNVLGDGRRVKNLSRAELSEFIGYHVPSLAEALEATPDLVWDIEIKDVGAVQASTIVLRDFVRRTELFVSSFVHAAVRQMVQTLGIRGALLVAHCPDGPLFRQEHLAAGVDAVVWDCDTVDSLALDWATSLGLRNMVYGYRPGPEHAGFLSRDLAAIITDFNESLNQHI